MTERLEWDFPPTKRYRRHPRVEIMEPQEHHRVEITVEHHRRPPPRFLAVLIAVVVALLLLWRYPLGFLLLGALVGWQVLSMFLFVAVILALFAWRDHRRGRPF
jgi:hypothetical protein